MAKSVIASGGTAVGRVIVGLGKVVHAWIVGSSLAEWWLSVEEVALYDLLVLAATFDFLAEHLCCVVGEGETVHFFAKTMNVVLHQSGAVKEWRR